MFWICSSGLLSALVFVLSILCHSFRSFITRWALGNSFICWDQIFGRCQQMCIWSTAWHKSIILLPAVMSQQTNKQTETFTMFSVAQNVFHWSDFLSNNLISYITGISLLSGQDFESRLSDKVWLHWTRSLLLRRIREILWKLVNTGNWDQFCLT